MSYLKNRLKNAALIVIRRLQHTQAQVQIKPYSKPIQNAGPVFQKAKYFPEKIAIRDRIASYTYANIFMSANELSKEISALVKGKTNERILFLCPNDVQYVITLWAIWMSGQIAVPLSPLHPKNLLLYYANDTSSSLLITTTEYADLMHRVARNTSSHLHVLDDKLKLNCTLMSAESPDDLYGGREPEFYDKNSAVILYTSGTTGSPKGAVLTHRNISFQINALVNAWRWAPDDVILHPLPLHHVHGLVNALLCPLSIGAKTIMMPKFDSHQAWAHLLGVNARPSDRRITVFMGVPTMYKKLLDEYEKVFGADPKMVEYIKNTLKQKVRLMVSGSAPLPVPLYEKWLQVSGHRLLERYGMTETGMILSNVYDSNREPGYVGVPLPGVSVRIVEVNEDGAEGKTMLECTNNDGNIIYTKNAPKDGPNPVGELLVRGPNVFKEYFNRPEATRKEFTADGWFKTGDMCEYDVEKKKFKLLGRKSVDIIKSGGYKISALEIETQLLANPDISDCAVLGVEDEKWGQKILAVIVPHKGKELKPDELKKFASDRMPKYAVPSEWKILEEIPKNTMGKVNKKELVRKLFE